MPRDYHRPPKCFRIMWHKKRKRRGGPILVKVTHRFKARVNGNVNVDTKRCLLPKRVSGVISFFFLVYKLHGCCGKGNGISKSTCHMQKRFCNNYLVKRNISRLNLFDSLRNIYTMYFINILTPHSEDYLKLRIKMRENEMTKKILII